MTQIISHNAPFDLRNQNSFFGGWPVLRDTEQLYSVAISFPVEQSQESACVVISQSDDGTLSAESFSSERVKSQAIQQALATLSLDVDDSKWKDVGEKDEVVSKLQNKYSFLRPILFHSPYEAAAGFIIGQRISVKQRQAIQNKFAQLHGEKLTAEDQEFSAFPTPEKLLTINEFSGLSPAKLERLHNIASAAIEGKLDRKYLLGLETDEALIQLQSLPGIGPFYASGILYRGAGIVDGVTDDDLTKYAVEKAYELASEPNQKLVLEIAQNWKPYRMWCEVLLHIWLRREIGLPSRKK